MRLRPSSRSGLIRSSPLHVSLFFIWFLPLPQRRCVKCNHSTLLNTSSSPLPADRRPCGSFFSLSNGVEHSSARGAGIIWRRWIELGVFSLPFFASLLFSLFPGGKLLLLHQHGKRRVAVPCSARARVFSPIIDNKHSADEARGENSNQQQWEGKQVRSVCL